MIAHLVEDEVSGSHLALYLDGVPVVLFAGLEGPADVLPGQLLAEPGELCLAHIPHLLLTQLRSDVSHPVVRQVDPHGLQHLLPGGGEISIGVTNVKTILERVQCSL